VYGSAATIGNDVTLSTACQSIMNASVLDFNFASSEMTRICTGLKAMAANGQYSISNGVLTLNGPASFVAGSVLVFKVKLLDLLNLQSLQFVNFPKASDIKAIVFNADITGITIPQNFAFNLPATWSFGALDSSPFKSKLIFNFADIGASLSFSASDNTTRDFFGMLLAPNVILNAGSQRIRFFGPAWLKSFVGQYLISEKVLYDFCLTDLVPMPAPTTQQPTIIETITTLVPSVSGTTKIPSTTSVPVTTQVPSVIGTTKVPATSA